MRIGAHAAIAFGHKRLQLRDELPGRIERFFRRIASHPCFEQLQMRGVFLGMGDWHLMRAPEAFDLEPIDLLRTRPALRAAQHDHGPSGPLAVHAPDASMLLDGADARERNIQRIRHLHVHFFWIAAFDKQRFMPVALKEIADLLVAHAP